MSTKSLGESDLSRFAETLREEAPRKPHQHLILIWGHRRLNGLPKRRLGIYFQEPLQLAAPPYVAQKQRSAVWIIIRCVPLYLRTTVPSDLADVSAFTTSIMLTSGHELGITPMHLINTDPVESRHTATTLINADPVESRHTATTPTVVGSSKEAKVPAQGTQIPCKHGEGKITREEQKRSHRCHGHSGRKKTEADQKYTK